MIKLSRELKISIIALIIGAVISSLLSYQNGGNQARLFTFFSLLSVVFFAVYGLVVSSSKKEDVVARKRTKILGIIAGVVALIVVAVSLVLYGLQHLNLV